MTIDLQILAIAICGVVGMIFGYLAMSLRIRLENRREQRLRDICELAKFRQEQKRTVR